MNLRCRNCGSGEIIVGEAGQRTRCAKCGGVTFAGLRKFGNGTALQGHGPKHGTLTISTLPGVPFERARKMFAEIHALIDSTPDVFQR